MKRFIMWGFPFALFFAVFVRTSSAMASDSGALVAKSEAAYLETSFKATDARASSFLIHDYSQVDTRFLSISDLLGLAETMSSSLGLTNVTAGKRVGDQVHIVQLNGIWSDHSKVSIVLSSFHMTDDMPDGTILTVRAKSNAGNLLDLAPHMSAMARELQHLQIPIGIDAYIAGYVKPRLSQTQTNHVIAHAFDVVHAKQTEGLTSRLVTSISGYSAEEPAYIVSKGKMNLQVAVHWNGYDAHTDIIVGTPFIVDSY